MNVRRILASGFVAQSFSHLLHNVRGNADPCVYDLRCSFAFIVPLSCLFLFHVRCQNDACVACEKNDLINFHWFFTGRPQFHIVITDLAFILAALVRSLVAMESLDWIGSPDMQVPLLINGQQSSPLYYQSAIHGATLSDFGRLLDEYRLINCPSGVNFLRDNPITSSF